MVGNTVLIAYKFPICQEKFGLSFYFFMKSLVLPMILLFLSQYYILLTWKVSVGFLVNVKVQKLLSNALLFADEGIFKFQLKT